MKFTNIYVEKNLIPVFTTDKATLFKFDAQVKDIGDVVLNIWLPNWAFANTKKIFDLILDKKEKLVSVDLQIIEDFNYRVFNKELNIEINNINIDQLLKGEF